MRPKRLTPAERDELRERVLAACHAILASGRVPSERQLRDHFPDRGVDLLVNLRDELRGSGRLKWAPDPARARRSRGPRSRPAAWGLDSAGRKPWEQRVKTQCEIRALKMERGEAARMRMPLSVRAAKEVLDLGTDRLELEEER